MNILIVDDEKDYCLSVRDFFRAKGIQADSALDGEEAKALLESNKYDLIFFDFNIPGITGVDLAGIINENNPDAKKVLVSGYDLVDEKFTSYLKIDQFLKKPVTASQLYSFVK